METATHYFTKAEIWLCTTTLLYFLMNGAQIFETLVFVPKWVASPQENLRLLNDGNGVSLKLFWIVFHSLHELAFLLAIFFCWKIEPVRNGLLGLFVLHIAVRAWTLGYFAPNIIDFQRMAQTNNFGEDLISRTALWQKLNYVRVLLYLAISIGFVPLCVKLFHTRP
ncbi:transposase [Flavobacterium caeni]|uniref:Uncharacterized protein n=1 Tax=Flavobacterium caeni TaxID=490189 RepID=A0A1G5IQ39_9FLAO|nr:transposase [Flavobacterium caeni]SCY77528.1 hypothetical protein SAMN02927903_02340 [Flavobacterium caeni]